MEVNVESSTSVPLSKLSSEASYSKQVDSANRKGRQKYKRLPFSPCDMVCKWASNSSHVAKWVFSVFHTPSSCPLNVSSAASLESEAYSSCRPTVIRLIITSSALCVVDCGKVREKSENPMTKMQSKQRRRFTKWKLPFDRWVARSHSSRKRSHFFSLSRRCVEWLTHFIVPLFFFVRDQSHQLLASMRLRVRNEKRQTWKRDLSPIHRCWW